MNEYGMYNDLAMGVYTQQNQFDLDHQKLTMLGFNSGEIQTLELIVNNGGKVSTNALTMYGLSYDQARRLRYMYDICIGKVVIESTEDLCKHLRKMFGGHRRIGIQDLAVSKINKVPRKAVVAGIKDETFCIYNSANYPILERLYDVVNVTPTRITIETDRKPVLKFKQPKYVEGVVEIKEAKPNGKALVAFDKKYCKLCNRYIIVAGLRRPEYHLGMVEIICIEGTKVYVYASNMGTKESVSYSMMTQRVYDYGVFPNQIGNKLKAAASELYKQLCGVYAEIIQSNQDYSIIPFEDLEEDDIEIED